MHIILKLHNHNRINILFSLQFQQKGQEFQHNYSRNEYSTQQQLTNQKLNRISRILYYYYKLLLLKFSLLIIN